MFRVRRPKRKTPLRRYLEETPGAWHLSADAQVLYALSPDKQSIAMYRSANFKDMTVERINQWLKHVNESPL